MKTNSSQEGAATSSKKNRFDKKNVNVRVNPFINFQIGLVAALLFAFVIMEITSTRIEINDEPRAIAANTPDDDWEHKTFTEVPNEEIKKVELPKAPKDVPPKIVPDETPEPDPTPDLEPEKPVIKPVEGKAVDSKPATAPTKAKGSPAPKTPITTTMDGVDSMPLFPGCESLDNNADRKKCFNEQMTRFVQRKFDTGIANGIGLESGSKVKITVLFTIDENGRPTDIKVRAPHQELEKESYRVIRMLPRITPGKIKGEAVSVYFALPIIFKVSD